MKVLTLILLSSLLLIANVYASENLFVRSSGLSVKGKLFSKLYKEAKDLSPDHGIEDSEDRVAAIARNAPLLGTQAVLSAFVCSNCIAQLFNVVPQTFTTRIRQQCLLVVIAVKLMDLYRELDIAPFEQRDNLFSDDLIQRAVSEVRALAGGTIGRTISYYCLCLTTVGQAEGCLAPFAISELPNLLRFGLIAVAAASSPGGSGSVPNGALAQLLFQGGDSSTAAESQSSKSTESSLDRICSGISSALEVYVVVRTLLRLLDFRGAGAVRGTQDMLVLAVQLLLIQTHLTLRARDLLKDRGVYGISMQSLLSLPGAEQVSVYIQPVRQRLHKVVMVIQRLISADTRPAAWRALQSALGVTVEPKSHKKTPRKGKSKHRGIKARQVRSTVSESATGEVPGAKLQNFPAEEEGRAETAGGDISPQ
jgi:hypothetical protein